MQNKFRYSLNAMRVFATAAQYKSLKVAGEALSVTPGAVSRQVKTLEESLGVELFHRHNNSIMLTEAGQSFYDEITPALVSLDSAAQNLHNTAGMITLRVGISIAVRWLIPRLESFKQQHPEIRIRLETTHHTYLDRENGIDFTISYCKDDQQIKGGQLLMEDACLPMISPHLLAKHPGQTLNDLSLIPSLSGTTDDWDWKLWSEYQGLDKHKPNIVAQFDNDDAVIHAGVAGLGMIMMSPLMTQSELKAGTLIPFPKSQPVKLGSYWLLSSKKSGRLHKAFYSWLVKEAQLQEVRLSVNENYSLTSDSFCIGEG